jgi:hypothetical protein
MCLFTMCVKSTYFKLMCYTLQSIVGSNASVQIKADYRYNSKMSRYDTEFKRFDRLEAVMIMCTESVKKVSYRGVPYS